MKGTFFLGASHTPVFETRDITLPKPAPREVLIRVQACGVCGTDVHIYHGEKGSAEVNPPVILGHEFSGIAEAVGDAVTAIRPGDHVTVDPNMYCGICTPCRMGRKQNCEHLSALGVTQNGGFAEYCLAPQTQCFRVDPSLSFEAAAMVEPLACAIHGMDLANVRPGQTVLIIGGGPIGLLMIQLARLSGAARVLLSEPLSLRRELGVRLGVDGAVDPTAEDLIQSIRNYSGREGADVVIECVGRENTAAQAVEAAAPGGTVLLFGVPGPDARLSLPLFDVYKKELTIRGSMINPDTHQRAVELLNSGRLDADSLITHHYFTDQLEEAILMQQSSESIKVMVHPR